ncbi:MAG: right-handed parallel beta-helix repeat-containing protein [Candidatus Schekmanbacteria bacterium]|nr:right-handed parallel beta-helix repeat-containing protein [Candidatus Schekmanbacteria bacterium]
MSTPLIPPCAHAARVTTTAELNAAVAAANQGGDLEIVLAAGTYDLTQTLYIAAAGVTVRGESGRRDDVVLRGAGMTGGIPHVFGIQAADVTVRDLTLGWVANHGVQVHGELDADRPLLSNLHIVDTFEQMVKVSYRAGDPVSADGGVLEDSLLEYAAGIGPQWYIGGIDAHQAHGWTVRRNVFRGIRSPADALAEHAVHFWSEGSDTLVERNLIVNCDRGIGFGLGDRGHAGGVIRNNMIYHDASEGFADVGIGLESAPGAAVLNNTIIFENSYPNAIEYRFASTTGVAVTNNLTNRAIAARDGASASLESNLVAAELVWFTAPAAGDLHLAVAAPEVVDRGAALPDLVDDFDGESRPAGNGVDIGADEVAGSDVAISWPAALAALLGLGAPVAGWPRRWPRRLRRARAGKRRARP